MINIHINTAVSRKQNIEPQITRRLCFLLEFTSIQDPNHLAQYQTSSDHEVSCELLTQGNVY